MKKLPQDPLLCMSVVNTRLRDYYSDLDEFCEDYEVDKAELEEKLRAIGYEYHKHRNQFC